MMTLDKNYVTIGILISIFLGFLFPFGSSIKFLIPYLLAFLLFGNFLNIKIKFKKFFRKELLYFVLLYVFIFPFIFHFLSSFLNPDLRIGIMLVVLAPVAIISPVVVEIIKGSKELTLSAVMFSNLLSPLIFTFFIGILFPSKIEFPLHILFFKVFAMIFVPLLVSIIFRQYFKKSTKKIISIIKHLNPICLFMIIFVAVSSSSKYIFLTKGMELIVLLTIILGLVLFYFLLPWFLSNDFEIKKTLVMITGYKNTTIIIWIALSNFSEVSVVPIIFFITIHHIIMAIFINRMMLINIKNKIKG